MISLPLAALSYVAWQYATDIDRHQHKTLVGFLIVVSWLLFIAAATATAWSFAAQI